MKEFEQGKESRIREPELASGELYVAMFSLVSAVAGLEAAKIPVKFLGSDIAPEQIIGKLTLGFLDHDLRDTFTVVVDSYDGFLTDSSRDIAIKHIPRNLLFSTRLGYLRQYGNGLDMPPDAMSAFLGTSSRELVPA